MQKLAKNKNITEIKVEREYNWRMNLENRAQTES
jgi:hypothetical protein